MIEINKKQIRVWSMLGMNRTFGSVLEDLYEIDKRFILMTADTGKPISYDSFYRNHPESVMDLGIAEQNMIASGAGMVTEGFNVFASTYSTFITARALDQIRVNMGGMKIPLKLIGIGGGLSEGTLSMTHMGIDDIAALRCIAGMSVLVPCDALELYKMLVALMCYDKPAYVKLTGSTACPVINKADYDFQIGKSIVLREGIDVAIIACGAIINNVLKAADFLENDGISCKVINMHTISPIDSEMLSSVSGMKMIVSVEEHSVHGGLGGIISEWFSDKSKRPPHLIIGVDTDEYPDANEYESLLELLGLTPDCIANKISEHFRTII